MEKRALTDLFLKTVTAADPGKRRLIWDSVLPSFAIRVTDRGVKTFVVVRRPLGAKNPVFHKIGRYGDISLAEARQEARVVLGKFASGTPPAPLARNTFATLAENYIRERLPDLRSAQPTEARIRNKLIPRWGTLEPSTIMRRDVVAVVREVARDDGPGAAKSALAAASSIFAWAVDQDIGVTNNPCKGRWDRIFTPPPPRDRVLTDPELATIWHACASLEPHWTGFFRFLILVGQRRGEVAGARWDEFDLDAALWTIPRARMKGNVVHVVPLGAMACDLLRGLPRGPYAFSATGGRLAKFSNAKSRLDSASGVTGWRTHDLRRTFRTGLSKLGVDPIVAELLIGHRLRGILGVYDRHSYDPEKREALERWEGHLRALLV